MEEEIRDNRDISQRDNEEPIQTIEKSFSKIDLGKATIVVFMLAAALCAIVGFYFGMQYSINECNTQYGEFFSEHCCIKGECVNSVQGYNEFSIIDIGDINDK